MPVFQLNKSLIFPSVSWAEPDGLLAVGGDLSSERILLGYKRGIFPWYSGDQIMWWSPDPRFVLFPQDLRISKSMQKIIDKKIFDFRINSAFDEVIGRCKNTVRMEQQGTWITDEMEEAYKKLNVQGYAQSAEAWQDNKLVGGLYGVRLGNIFFGESMFSTVSNASKFAFIQFVKYLETAGVVLIDSQVYTSHLESLGAKMIPRNEFLNIISYQH